MFNAEELKYILGAVNALPVGTIQDVRNKGHMLLKVSEVLALFEAKPEDDVEGEAEPEE